MLLALVLSGRFIGNLTAVPTSERTVSAYQAWSIGFLSSGTASSWPRLNYYLTFDLK